MHYSFLLTTGLLLFIDTCGGTVTITANQFLFTDGSGAALPSRGGSTCNWIIKPSIAVPSITLIFNSINIGYYGNEIYVYSSVLGESQVLNGL